jgi:TPR repeat protein
VAQYNLGVTYGEGHGVPQDQAAAVAWYGKAAEQGHAKAQNNLGMTHARGRVEVMSASPLEADVPACLVEVSFGPSTEVVGKPIAAARRQRASIDDASAH